MRSYPRLIRSQLEEVPGGARKNATTPVKRTVDGSPQIFIPYALEAEIDIEGFGVMSDAGCSANIPDLREPRTAAEAPDSSQPAVRSGRAPGGFQCWDVATLRSSPSWLAVS